MIPALLQFLLWAALSVVVSLTTFEVVRFYRGEVALARGRGFDLKEALRLNPDFLS